MGAGGEQGEAFLDQVAEVERQFFQHQLAGLDLGEVEHLVDDSHQAVGGFLDGGQVVELTRGHVAFQQQMGEADESVERGADLVAHVGEELGLDAAGLQRLLARQVQFDVLDLDGFQVLPDVLGGLVDAVLHFLLGALQGLGHAVDTGRERVQFLVADQRQACFQSAFAQLRDALLNSPQRAVDRTRQAQREQGGGKQGQQRQQQAGEQSLIGFQQDAAVGNFHVNPAQQVVGRGGGLGAQVVVAAEHRQAKACAVAAAGQGQTLAVGQRVEVLQARAGMRGLLQVGIADVHAAHIILFQRGFGDALQASALAGLQGGGGEHGELFADQGAAGFDLLAQVRQLSPAEVAAQYAGQQGAGQQGEQQYSALDA